MKGLLYAVNTESQIPESGIINFGSAGTTFGEDIVLRDSSVYFMGAGCFAMDANIVLHVMTPGEITVSLLLNGKAIEGGSVLVNMEDPEVPVSIAIPVIVDLPDIIAELSARIGPDTAEIITASLMVVSV